MRLGPVERPAAKQRVQALVLERFGFRTMSFMALLRCRRLLVPEHFRSSLRFSSLFHVGVLQPDLDALMERLGDLRHPSEAELWQSVPTAFQEPHDNKCIVRKYLLPLLDSDPEATVCNFDEQDDESVLIAGE